MKYMGSKARISAELSEIINKLISQNSIDTYIEPFVGGANVIDKVVCKNKIGSDNNEYLIELYNSMKKGYKPRDFISKEDYYDIKLNKDKYTKEEVALCGVLASYNGNWFRAYGGYSATKTGKDRNYYAEGVRGLQKQMPNLMNVDFRCCDYKEYSNIENALIYCDAPYSSGDKNLYRKNQFNHIEYWNWIRMMSENNIVLVSEYNAPDDFYCLWEKQMSPTHANQKKVSVEKLFIIDEF